MNREDITRMAQEAGFVGFDGENKCLREFAALVAAAARQEEREVCARVCESYIAEGIGREMAEAIRAREQA